ncbi:MAG: BTAD domain-containing putative transcriptional regulator [Actinomycetota bacterium]
MRFSVLGPLVVSDGDATLPLGGLRQRSVLALLLLDAGRIVSADRIVTEIWTEHPPDGARDSLYTYVSNLRGILGKDRIVRVDGGYRLDLVDGDSIDVEECQDGLDRARRALGADPAVAIDLIDSSLECWSGRPYEGFEDLPSVPPEATRLEDAQLSALEDRFDAELRSGGTPLVSDIEALTRAHPYRERIWALLARSLYRAGRQTEALRTFTRLRRILGEELGLEPSPSITRLEERILVQDPTLEPEAPPPQTNLPTPVSSFIGRVDELIMLGKTVHEHRLVTVIAPGGAGKTRLAMEVAGDLLGSFPDGVWLADLALVSDPESVVQATAAALQIVDSPGVDGIDALVSRLRPRSSLIVLDNCEHVVESAGEMAVTLLEMAPNLKILATSRQALLRDGEVRFLLDGLDTSTDTAELGDAERLFEERAAAVRPEFRLDDGNREEVASICCHLDGMPLAIELAASRADVLSPNEIDQLLSNRFILLADEWAGRPAHRSLQASLDWSHGLLAPEEQIGFDYLGVFEGPFSLLAATAVLGSPPEVFALGRLRHLVGASLVQTVPGETVAYRLLETMRLYARDHLIEAKRWDDAAERHDRHYRDRCGDLRAAFFGSGRVGAQREIEAELAEYHAAFDRFVEHDRIEDALEMAWSLGHVWLFSGRLGEDARRLAVALDRSVGSESRSRADALTAASFLGMYVANYGPATAWADEALGIYQSIGDEQGLAYALARRGHLAFSVGDAPAALEFLQRSLEICDRIGYTEGTAWPLSLLAQARLWSGDEGPEVQRMFEEGRERFIEMGETYGQAHVDIFLSNLGDGSAENIVRYSLEMMELAERPDADPLMRPIAFHNLAYGVWYSGEFDRGEGLNRVASRLAIEAGATVNSGMTFLQAGVFAGERGQVERAATLLGAGHAHFGMQIPPFYERQIQSGIDAATQKLGEDRYWKLHGHGGAMTVEEATAYLLGS